MLMGQNLDVAYRGKVVHIQTEDLGRNVAKVMTQVFHAGAILESKTVSYAEEIARLDDVGQQNDHIRQLMLRLIKWFHKSIHSGAYDAKLKLAPLPAVDEAQLGPENPAVPSVNPQPENRAIVREPASGGLITAPAATIAIEHFVSVSSGADLPDEPAAPRADAQDSSRPAAMSDAWLAIASAYMSGTGRSFAGDLDFDGVDQRLVASLTASLHRVRA